MSRAALIVLDSVGCGFAPDAKTFGDDGADTLGHIAEGCAIGLGDRPGLRHGRLNLPNLVRLGLGHACEAAGGAVPPGLECDRPIALHGSAIETSPGKDTPSGHWEIAGTPAPAPFGYFPVTDPAFPRALVDAIISEGGIPGLLGNCHASGVEIIERFGAEHLRSGKPIAYTSVDSVLQIAAHEERFGLERLYALCETVRRLVDPLMIGRVIARPFLGDEASGFARTPNRKDFAMPPPEGGLLERAAHAGRAIVTLGKIGDIFAHRHTGEEVKAAGNMNLFDALLARWPVLPAGGLLFANFVDFDTEFGHRRDLPGYAACLEAFDARLAELLPLLERDDLLVITADHGNDPSFSGTDHTREQVPVLAYRKGAAAGSIGLRASLADIGQSVAAHLGLARLPRGASFL
ncbi:MAG: phosphopentomutase [Beijerinckiaceae bacterium]|nr:phosphopentomutase [Beijerinckiaceae bacterium]